MENNIENKQKNKYPLGIGTMIIMIVALVIQVAFLGMLIALNVLPFMYTAVLIAVMAGINAAVIVMMRRSKKGSNKRLGSNIIMIIIMIIAVMGCFYLLNTLDTFSKISSDGRQMEDFHVVVLNESKYASVEDIGGHEVYVVDTQSKMYNEAKERLLTKVEVEYKVTSSTVAVGSKLVDKKGKLHDEIVFLSDGNYQVLCEEDKAFKKNTKILYSVAVAVKTDDFARRINVTEDPFNIYISGVDTRGEIEDVCRSDVNMIVTVNPETKEILLTSMPRDSYVELPSVGMMDKLTHSGMYGIDETIATVENWLDVEINYYYRVNFMMLVDLVNAMGGITVDIPEGFHSTYWSYEFKTGENKMGGKKTLAFVRERKAFEDEDEDRIKNQQRVLKAILKKATNSEVILTKYSKILNAVEDSMQTNMTNKEITSLVKMQMKDMSPWTIKTVSVDGIDAEKGTYSMGPGRPLFVSIPKEKSVENVKEKIHEVMYPVVEE